MVCTTRLAYLHGHHRPLGVFYGRVTMMHSDASQPSSHPSRSSHIHYCTHHRHRSSLLTIGVTTGIPTNPSDLLTLESHQQSVAQLRLLTLLLISTRLSYPVTDTSYKDSAQLNTTVKTRDSRKSNGKEVSIEGYHGGCWKNYLLLKWRPGTGANCAESRDIPNRIAQDIYLHENSKKKGQQETAQL